MSIERYTDRATPRPQGGDPPVGPCSANIASDHGLIGSADRLPSTSQKASAGKKQKKKRHKKAKTQRKIEYDATMHRDELVNYLETILDGLREGSLHIKDEDCALALTPEGDVEVALRAKQRGRTERLRLEFEWRRSKN